MTIAKKSNLKNENYSSKPKTELKHRCYYFSIDIINFVNQFPERKAYWVVSNQLLRSATSIGANIVEAVSASSRRYFVNFYNISLKSANETKYWLGLLRDSELKNDIVEDKTSLLLKKVDELSNIIGASLITLKSKRKF